jgi:hypothetical protein
MVPPFFQFPFLDFPLPSFLSLGIQGQRTSPAHPGEKASKNKKMKITFSRKAAENAEKEKQKGLN